LSVCAEGATRQLLARLGSADQRQDSLLVGVKRTQSGHSELNTPRGDTGRQINQANTRITNKIECIDRFPQSYKGDDERETRFVGLRRIFKKLLSLHRVIVGKQSFARDVSRHFCSELCHSSLHTRLSTKWQQAPVNPR
jgi:hypothetical protein